jgi:RNA polymerase sigma-70 factor (ECF subfamily)
MSTLFRDRAKEKAFEELYEKYYAPFCLYAKRFIEDKCVREDLVSESFITIWDKKSTIDFKSKTIAGYLKICIKNSCLNYIRHQNYELKYIENEQFTQPSYAHSIDDIFTLEELYDMLNEALKKVPSVYREVFEKTFFHHKKRKEIAEELNISIKSVERYKQKTLELVRQDLKEFLPLFFLLLNCKS